MCNHLKGTIVIILCNAGDFFFVFFCSILPSAIQFKELQPDNCSLICHYVLFSRLVTNQLSAAANLYPAYHATRGGQTWFCLFNQWDEHTGSSFHFLHGHQASFVCEHVQSAASSSVWTACSFICLISQEWLHENRAGSVSVNHDFFAHLFCLMKPRISYVLLASRVLTASLLCASISQVVSPAAGCVCFIWTHSLTPADHKLRRRESERVEQTSIKVEESTF